MMSTFIYLSKRAINASNKMETNRRDLIRGDKK